MDIDASGVELDPERRFMKTESLQLEGVEPRISSETRDYPGRSGPPDNRCLPFAGPSESVEVFHTAGLRIRADQRSGDAKANEPGAGSPLAIDVPKMRVPKPRMIKSSGDQKTTISRRIARRAFERS